MKTTNDVVLELIDRDAEAEDMEALVAKIKSILESPYYNSILKVGYIQEAIEEAGY